MKFGFFDDDRKEYVITTPRTPLPWINYLGNEDFFTLLSNTAGGYSFFRDARLRRITRYRYNNCPLDQEGFHLYVKDGDCVWNPGWQPVQTDLDAYCCRHGLGYTVIEGKKNGIRVSQEFAVPMGERCMLMRVTVHNGTGEAKTLQVFPYLEFCLWDAMDDSSNFQRNYSTGEVEVVGPAIYHKTEYRERRDHYAVFWANRGPDAFDTAREAFIGTYGTAGRLRHRLHGQRGARLAADCGAAVYPQPETGRKRYADLRPRLYRESGRSEMGKARRHQQEAGRGHDRPLCLA